MVNGAASTSKNYFGKIFDKNLKKLKIRQILCLGMILLASTASLSILYWSGYNGNAQAITGTGTLIVIKHVVNDHEFGSQNVASDFTDRKSVV